MHGILVHGDHAAFGVQQHGGKSRHRGSGISWGYEAKNYRAKNYRAGFCVDEHREMEWKDRDSFSIEEIHRKLAALGVENYEEYCEYEDNGELVCYRAAGVAYLLTERMSAPENLVELRCFYRDDATVQKSAFITMISYAVAVKQAVMMKRREKSFRMSIWSTVPCRNTIFMKRLRKPPAIVLNFSPDGRVV